MEIKTKSGVEIVNKQSHYGKWVVGYCSTPAWSGANTLWYTWKLARNCKPDGVSWTAYGEICGRLVYQGVFVGRIFCEEKL